MTKERVPGIVSNMRRWLDATADKPLQQYMLDRDAVSQLVASLAHEPRGEQRMVPVCTGCNSFPCVCNILADLHKAPAVGLMPFTHWSKDPLVPYTGCTCSSCEDMREYLSMASDSTSPNRTGDV